MAPMSVAGRSTFAGKHEGQSEIALPGFGKAFARRCDHMPAKISQGGIFAPPPIRAGRP